MMYPDALLDRGREAVEAVSSCEACDVHRRPRMFVCSYHEGWLDAWEQAHDNASGQGGRS